MSDLHYGKDISLETSRLESLANWIKSKEINLDFVVFTGDMIDASIIQKKCITNLTTECDGFSNHWEKTCENDDVVTRIRSLDDKYITLYDNMLREITIQQTKSAAKLFNKFINSIGIVSSQVVLCCGNHDCIRFAKNCENVDCNDNSIDERKTEAAFESFDMLCSLINPKINHSTMTYTYNKASFVIANSNWQSSGIQGQDTACISCCNVLNEFSKLRNSNVYGDSDCIFFVAHKPYDDFCESAKYAYSESYSLTDTIKQFAKCFLCGDKHTVSAKADSKHQEYMCGSPISEPNVKYNLLHFDTDSNKLSCKYIMYDENGWKEIPNTRYLEAIYNTSSSYIEPHALKLLPTVSSMYEWDAMLKSMQRAYEGDVIDDLSRFFSSFSTLNDHSASKETESDNLFDQFMNLLKKSNTSQAIGVKGKPGQGKSTFLSIIYLYMFWQLSSGSSNMIPFYINMQKYTNSVKDSITVDDFINGATEEFTKFLDECQKHTTRDYPVVIIIDGLERHKLLSSSDNTIEAQIFRLAEHRFKDAQYVMCFNTHDGYCFDNSFEKINDFEYVLFLDEIRAIEYKTDEQKQNTFLSSYLSLCGDIPNEENTNKIKNALKKCHRVSIDLFYLDHLFEIILNNAENNTSWDVLKEQLNTLSTMADELFHSRTEIVRIAAYLLFLQKDYSEIIRCSKCSDLTPNEFLNLCSTPIIADYFVSQYYVQQLRHYSSDTNPIPNDSILYSFMPFDRLLIIRLLLDRDAETAGPQLRRFIANHRTELKGYLYSTIVYICGHLRSTDTSSLLKNMPAPEDIQSVNESAFFDLCCLRSYLVAQAACNDDTSSKEKIVLKLMDDEDFRKFDRSYQLHYYKDKKINPLDTDWDYKMPPEKGFDYRNTFLIILSNLQSALDNNTSYPLMELDLFTICDLTYSRLRYYNASGLFYSAKYNQDSDSESQAVLERICEILKSYNRGIFRYNPRIASYFKFMQEEFIDILKRVKSNTNQDVTVPYVSASSDFEQILKLKSLLRVGWNINQHGTVESDKFPVDSLLMDEKNETLIIETLMDHIIDSVYIAQLFLPEKLPSFPDYQKSKVISLILFSEIGRLKSHDYSPHYADSYIREGTETDGIASFITLGSIDNHAPIDIPLTPIRSDNSNDINVTICREIKMNQTEYKYYALYDSLQFNDDRRREFEDDFKEPTTPICKSIRRQLINMNPNFKTLFDQEVRHK